MSLLPLFAGLGMTETRFMSSTNSLSPEHRNWWQLLRSVSLTITRVVAECHHASRTMMELRLTPDRYLPDPAQAPDDYAEFLFRTSGPLAHEPSARQRAAGQRARR